MRYLAILATAAMAIAPLTASAASTAGTTIGATVNGEEACTIRTLSGLNFGHYDPVQVNGNLPASIDALATGSIGVLCTNQSHYALSPAMGSSLLTATNAPSLKYNYKIRAGGGPFQSMGAEEVFPIDGVLPKGQPAQNLVYTDAGFVITVSLVSSV